MKPSDESTIISVQYCTGYVDKQNQWRPGFNCTAQMSKQHNTTPLFCCGTSQHKYCCSTKQYIQLGYAGGHSNDVTYGTLLTVVLSTFIFSVMLTIIAFVCCKKFWKKSRENLNLELVDDQLYRNTNFLTLNATQLISAYGPNGLQTDAIQTPTSSTNALSPSITTNNNLAATNNSINNNINNNVNNSLPTIVTSMSPITSSNQTGQQLNALYSTTSTNSTPYTINQHQMNQSMNTAGLNGRSSIAMATGYSVHPQALQQALIFYEPPPPYNSSHDINRTYTNNTNNEILSTTNQQPINQQHQISVPSATTTNSTQSNIDLNAINLIPNQASASYQPSNQLPDDNHPNNTNDLPTNIWSQRLLLALGNYRRDCVYPMLDQPRKKLCRTLSQ